MARVHALEPCSPPWWARGGHRQTLLGHVLAWPAPPVAGERHRIRLSDGDQLTARHERGTTGVLVSIMHGLTGDADADYVSGIAAALRRAGHSLLAMNHRGCGEGDGLARGIYHSGRKEDVAAVVALGRELEPDAVHVALGVSLSGNALLLSLADPGLTKPNAVLAVNPPLDLNACSDAIASGWNRIYERRFVRRLRRVIRRRWEQGLLEREPDLPRGIGLRGFDDHFTAAQGGFADADDYYRRCSAGPHLGKVEVPTIIVTAADDPFVPVQGLIDAARGTAVKLHVEAHGGHLGYLSSRPRRWLDYAVPLFVEELASTSVVSRS